MSLFDKFFRILFAYLNKLLYLCGHKFEEENLAD